MRILHISTTDNEGAGLCCLRIHDALLKSGVESKVVVWHNTKREKEEYQYGYWRYRITKIPSKILRALGFSLTKYNKIRKLSKENKTIYSLPISPVKLHKNKWVEWADIIHLHWVCNFLDYPSFFGFINKPIVWTLHDEYFFYGIAHYSNQVLVDNYMEKYYVQLKKESLLKIHNLNVVMLSNFFYSKFSDHTFLRGRGVYVINNPIDTKVFSPSSKIKARKKYGIDDGEIVIAFTAININDTRKGLDVLSQVVSDMNNPRFKILAIGNNSSQIKRSNVLSIGTLKNGNDISEALSAADFFAMPSYQEAFPQSPMEAMACGLPVVAFPVSGTSELINEKNGVICDDFTSDALKRGIETLLKREYSAEEIRQDMIDRFSPDSIAEKYRQLYKKILK